ncbi:MAG TPA: hypothetical protein VMV06_09280 [Acidimicrobiales bacterium]|nr:hypothetical protein [Acidimicrobiales bacterium]
MAFPATAGTGALRAPGPAWATDGVAEITDVLGEGTTGDEVAVPDLAVPAAPDLALLPCLPFRLRPAVLGGPAAVAWPATAELEAALPDAPLAFDADAGAGATPVAVSWAVVRVDRAGLRNADTTPAARRPTTTRDAASIIRARLAGSGDSPRSHDSHSFSSYAQSIAQSLTEPPPHRFASQP